MDPPGGEGNREAGLQEAEYKLFTGGGDMLLRRNHEAQSHYANYKNTGKAWCKNVGDIEFVETAEEVSHARRPRGIFCRSEFTSDLGKAPSTLVGTG